MEEDGDSHVDYLGLNVFWYVDSIAKPNWNYIDGIAYTMFNVWLPAVLESRAKGEGDEAIKQALQEFVLYSGTSLPIFIFIR